MHTILANNPLAFVFARFLAVNPVVKSYMEDIQQLPEFLGASTRYATSAKPNPIYVLLDLENNLKAQESLEEIIINSGV